MNKQRTIAALEAIMETISNKTISVDNLIKNSNNSDADLAADEQNNLYNAMGNIDTAIEQLKLYSDEQVKYYTDNSPDVS